jgi:hypothetical protein
MADGVHQLRSDEKYVGIVVERVGPCAAGGGGHEAPGAGVSIAQI